MPDLRMSGRTLRIPANEYPAVLVFYKMNIPGILLGLPDDIDTSNTWTFLAIDDEARRTTHLAKYPDNLAVKFQHVPQDFGRLLLKIGFCQALTTVDPGDFEPICLPYILGQKQNVSYLVGNAAGQHVPQPFGYNLGTEFLGNLNELLVVANVRLYANTFAPGYQVVVGRVKGAELAAKILSKVEARDGLEVQPLTGNSVS
ncbi:hypothetical protein D769_04304 [Cupriavidus sp. HMR-1]|uniref:hypothetical protein n=1 Tax=Cupriavidus sp. HMR-1 TaxID=1249621 RepID=UPI0002A1C440|nr:hypothetical protein [Cupriavidus sp. HMR-1]ELA00621.1 hypothetical protein D769_04304 [Cupriavidus sp. HMR-1]